MYNFVESDGFFELQSLSNLPNTFMLLVLPPTADTLPEFLTRILGLQFFCSVTYFLQKCLPLGPSGERMERTKARGIPPTLLGPQFLSSERVFLPQSFRYFPSCHTALPLWELPWGWGGETEKIGFFHSLSHVGPLVPTL